MAIPDRKSLCIALWNRAGHEPRPQPRERLFPALDGYDYEGFPDGTCSKCGMVEHAPTCAHVRPAAPPQPASRDARPDIGDYNGAYANRFASAAQESAEQPASRCSDGAPRPGWRAYAEAKR